MLRSTVLSSCVWQLEIIDVKVEEATLKDESYRGQLRRRNLRGIPTAQTMLGHKLHFLKLVHVLIHAYKNW